MKTITEFAAVTLANAAKTKQELTAAGKTPEELPQALGEALKVEGDKLNLLLAALEVAGGKTTDLKRVIVMTLNEGESAPSKAQKKGDHYFMTEFYAPLHAPRGGREHDRSEGRGERGGHGGRGGPRGGKGGGREGGRDRGPRREGGAPAGGQTREAGASRPPRQPKAPREPVKVHPPGFKIAPRETPAQTPAETKPETPTESST